MQAKAEIISGPYLRDLLDQPEALRRTAAGLAVDMELQNLARATASGKYHRIVLTGMGSSYAALHPIHLALNRRGLVAQMVETSELTHSLGETLDNETLIIAVSQSGRSAEIVNLLEMASDRSPVIGVTNSPDSLLGTRSDARIVTHAGTEASVSCKTYVASLLALRWLAAVLIGDDLDQTRSELESAAAATEQYLQAWESHVTAFRRSLGGVTHVFFTGRGDSLAAAETAGLITKESARFPAEGMGCATFRHGPFEMVGPAVLVIVLAGSARVAPLNRKLVRDVELAGGRATLVECDAPEPHLRLPHAPDSVRPILEILPPQMLSLALASLRGFEAGRFERASKVTTVE